MRSRILALAVLACLAAGCGTTARVTFSPGPRQDIRSVAVLIFDDAALSDEAADYFLTGHTSGSGAGRIVAKMLGQALAEKRTYAVLRGTPLAQACLEANIEFSKLHQMSPVEVGRKLNVQGIVTGKVTAFGQTWFVFLARAQVAFEARCLNVRTGKIAWRAQAKSAAAQGVGADVALEASREIAEQIAAQAAAAEDRK